MDFGSRRIRFVRPFNRYSVGDVVTLGSHLAGHYVAAGYAVYVSGNRAILEPKQDVRLVTKGGSRG